MTNRAQSVLVTGTTSGVGRALLEHYTSAGAKVIAVNRRRVRELESQHPSVRFECVDVRSPEAVSGLVERLSGSDLTPDVFILNAGINRVDNDESFRLAAYKEVVDTNLYGVLNFVEPLTELPPGPAARHVIAISSLASYVGNPYGLGYHVSKRALSASFDVWSRMYAGTDLVFQQVLLGPVPTAIETMAEDFPPWMAWTRDAFSTSKESAAQAVARFAQTRNKTLIHPWRAVPLYLGMRLGQSLVPGFFQGRKTRAGKARRAGAARRAAHEQEK